MMHHHHGAHGGRLGLYVWPSRRPDPVGSAQEYAGLCPCGMTGRFVPEETSPRRARYVRNPLTTHKTANKTARCSKPRVCEPRRCTAAYRRSPGRPGNARLAMSGRCSSWGRLRRARGGSPAGLELASAHGSTARVKGESGAESAARVRAAVLALGSGGARAGRRERRERASGEAEHAP